MFACLLGNIIVFQQFKISNFDNENEYGFWKTLFGLGSSKVDVEHGANLQCKSKACFLPCFRQFEIRRMFTLQLQRQKNKKIRPWERSHWKADKICHRIQSAHDFGTYFFVFKIYPKT